MHKYLIILVFLETSCGPKQQVADEAAGGGRTVSAENPRANLPNTIADDQATNIVDHQVKNAAWVASLSQELQVLGNGSKRFQKIESFVSAANPEDILNFILSNQANLSANDFNGVSFLTSKLAQNPLDAILAAVGKIRDVSLRRILFNSAASRLSTLRPEELKPSLKLLATKTLQSEFLTPIFSHKININFEEYMMQIHDAKSLLFNNLDTTPANQFVGDSARAITSDLVGDAWKHLDKINDKTTRRLVAQGLFHSMYDADTLKASEWLASLPNDENKQAAVSSLVQTLTAEGDAEAAKAWLESLDH